MLPAFELQDKTVTGLIATIPGYARLDVGEVTGLVERIYPGRAPPSVQVLVVLTENDEAHLVLALDTHIDRFITAGTISGRSAPLPPSVPAELDFVKRLIVSDNVILMEPLKATPDQVNQSPEQYAFKRVSLDTTYVFSSVRIKNAPPSLNHIGFGLATDNLGSQSRDDYLTVIDPYNTEAQIRVAALTGTALFPTEGARRLLGQLYKFAPDDVTEALSKPSLFYEVLVDDEAELHNIRDLSPTAEDPKLKLHTFHSGMVRVRGLALGEMVKTEDIPVPYIKNIPIHVTAKLFGVVDLTGAMPIVGISSEDVSGEVFGFFRFDLSVYDFGDEAAYAFLINKEAVPLDPVAEVDRAQFGDRVKATLHGYSVVETERIQLSQDLTLEQVDWLMPSEPGSPVIMTRHDDLRTGDYLDSVSFDGYMLDGRLLGVPQPVPFDEPKTIVVNATKLSFTKGVAPAFDPPIAPTAAPTPTPTTVAAVTTPSTLSPTSTPTPTSTRVPEYFLTMSTQPSDGGTIAFVPVGGTYISGEQVMLTALAALGFTFDRWEGDASGSDAITTVT